MARFAMKYINESSRFMQSACWGASYYNMYTLVCNEYSHSQSAWSEIWRSQMISHAGGGYGDVWYKLVHANLLGRGLQSWVGKSKIT